MVTIKVVFEVKAVTKSEEFSGVNYHLARKEFKKKYPKAKVVTEQVISKMVPAEA